MILALHVPFGALAFMALARGLGLRVEAAASGALVYALGGFYLSCLNLYVYVEAAAWAPLVVLGLLRAAEGSRRWQAAAAVAIAAMLSTTGAEVAGQALVIGALLAIGAGPARRLLRAGWSLALGIGLTAPTILVMRGLVADSARGRGFPVDVVLAQSIHPLTLVQVLVGNWLGDLSNLANQWWGSNFFPLGFPYVLSLYLGATVLSLALVGAFSNLPFRRRLVFLAAASIVLSLGRWAHLAGLVEAAPILRAFRHPSKLFFSAHFAIALLAGLGVQRLAEPGEPGAWRALAWWASALGLVLCALPLFPLLAPSASHWFLNGFLPPGADWPRRMAVGDWIVSDSAVGGSFAIAAGLISLATCMGHMRRSWSVWVLAGLVATDLLRTGAGAQPHGDSFLLPDVSPDASGDGGMAGRWRQDLQL